MSLTFGTKGADVTIDDQYASAVHCQVTKTDSGWWVQDLSSLNGTWIMRKGFDGPPLPGVMGGIRIYGPTPLRPGDRIRIGRTILPWEVPA